MIEALSHITLIVRDVEKTGHFLRSVFAGEEVYDSGPRNFSLSYEKYFLVAGVWIAVMEGEPLPGRSYNHIAFKVSDAEFDNYVDKVRRCGLETAPGRGRVEGEARSIYFYDYDNHLFELHTGTLSKRIAAYRSGAGQTICS